MALAARSLPVPVSPCSSTVEAGLAATFAITAFTALIAGDSPMTRSNACGSLSRARSAFTSRRNWLVSSAFEIVSRSWSNSNGFFA